MTAEKRMITTRELKRLMTSPAPDPETKPKPILSHTLKLRGEGIDRHKLPKAIDRSGQGRLLTTHDDLRPREEQATPAPGPAIKQTAIKISEPPARPAKRADKKKAKR